MTRFRGFVNEYMLEMVFFCPWLVSKILLVAFKGVTSLADVLRLCYAFLMSWLLMSSASNLVHVTSYICVRPKHQWGSNHSNNPFYVKFALTFLTVFSNEWVPAWTTICSVAIIVAVSSVLTRIRVTRIKDWQINQRKHTQEERLCMCKIFYQCFPVPCLIICPGPLFYIVLFAVVYGCYCFAAILEVLKQFK